MIRLGFLLAVLAACNQWVRAEPPPAHSRTIKEQWDAAVTVTMACDPFGDGTFAQGRVGSGVMVSDWQVLTALHVVDCQSTIPSIWVTNREGKRWRFAPEREWSFSFMPTRDGIARIQMRSADTLSPRLVPPTAAPHLPQYTDVLYMQAAFPFWVERAMEATGSWYGSRSLGATLITYDSPSQEGNSGAAVYDTHGDLVGIHLGRWADDVGFAAIVTQEMLP